MRNFRRPLLLLALALILVQSACGRRTTHFGSGGPLTAESPPPDGSTGGSHPPQPDSPEHSMTLTWTASTSTVDGYHVLRGTQDGGPYTVIADLGATASAYIDKDVLAGKSYFYVCTAFTISPAAVSVYSNQAGGTIPTP